jgi:hypothetical protein
MANKKQLTSEQVPPRLNGDNDTIEKIIKNIRKQMYDYQVKNLFDKTFDSIDEDLDDIETLLIQQKERDQKGYWIPESDKVNAFLAPIMRELNESQMIELRNKLIDRTPKNK